ncbi:beta-glucoside-specific PTS transporter subunit IIABC [Pediococcus acidilactici]|jgi:PTS system beta-glucosides-specific IIC component|uniref:beta-glucoside-specific PTS transporter subunit IIABC n=1 Tax=Pediococcus acidilactici TaxID=1254 RepID=UPI0006B5E60E|nr:beta-glucoside-specific PTS transporter subunit IIABC [Pediococcus acidilactici]KAF0373235.1 PTS beta-glucoside transporter subunit EIIBCA [Pediococcus acidilactici]KAF0383573.1 PTS beta-glucoside transporter subunit EIIBCA [Pediococcus acidilactici]KAF0457557.1 PTS beta-glucoside transporter subunit EIIBCA [Pediococcus acidilactici]KAF0477008.1 PTS beta-glucoside transporter subunit EIIBCA [Pediococcus acidilactici]KAF0488945.1 PTS beta-glucoside transporter subunit EIIBCA [Pediococcus aci
MKYKEFNENIIKYVGGKENIQAVVHCMTRLRFTLKDRNKANTAALKDLDGVIDVVSNNVAYQIIIGTHVVDVYDELIDLLGISGNDKEEVHKVKKNWIKAVLDVVSESMTPILEPIICAGLLAAFLSIISLTGLISPNSPTYQIFDALRVSVFYFLPILMAMSSAKRLGASPYLAVALAATILSESINGVKGLNLFGIPLPQITYANSFIPILLAVWFMGYVTKFVKRIVPNALQYFMTPLLIMLITLPATLLIFGPLGYYLGEGIIAFFNLLMKYVGSWFVMMLYSALQPFIVMLGAGNFIMPVVASLISANGYDPAFISSCTISDIAVGGSMLGYFLRTRNRKQKQLFGTVTLSAILGVTEPAIYGVFVKYRRPFIAVMIGGGLGGLFAGLTGVKAYSIAWGLFGLPAYIGKGHFMNLWLMVASVIISFVGAAIAAFLLGVPAEDSAEEVPGNVENAVASKLQTVSLSSVVKGDLVQLAEVGDAAFSTGAMGKGIGIKPIDDHIHAPIDGKVTAIFPTKHAIGITGSNGIEILIHIGIDTVELEGKYFALQVKEGETVSQGDVLAVVDFSKVVEAGYDPTVMVIITNTNDFLDVIPSVNQIVTDKDQMLNVVLG